MADGTSRKLCLTHCPFNGAYFCGGGEGGGREGTDHFRSSGTNGKLLRGVIGPGLLPYIHAKIQNSMMLLACAGAVETMPSHGSHGKSFSSLRVKSLSLQRKGIICYAVMLYIYFLGGGAESSGEPGENKANRLLVQKVYIYSIYICISFHKLGVAGHSIRKKVLLYYYIKPLHCTVGSPMSSHYEGLVYVSLAQKNYTLFLCFVLTKIDSLVLA